MPEPKEVPFTVGRAIDKLLTGAGEVAYGLMAFAAIIAFALYVLPTLEGVVYLGALLVLAAGSVVAIGALIYQKRKQIKQG